MTEPHLTLQETRVLHGIANGMTREAIAKELGITSRTVINYVASIMVKLDCRSSEQAMFVATVNGLIHAGVTNKLSEIEVE